MYVTLQFRVGCDWLGLKPYSLCPHKGFHRYISTTGLRLALNDVEVRSVLNGNLLYSLHVIYQLAAVSIPLFTERISSFSFTINIFVRCVGFKWTMAIVEPFSCVPWSTVFRNPLRLVKCQKKLFLVHVCRKHNFSKALQIRRLITKYSEERSSNYQISHCEDHFWRNEPLYSLMANIYLCNVKKW